MKLFVAISTLFFVLERSESANILAVIPSPFYSHQATWRPLWRELSKKGHKITLITTNPMEKNENITQIDYSGTYEMFEKLGIRDMFMKNSSILRIFFECLEAGDEFVKYQFTHPGLVELLQKNTKFDLLFIEVALGYFSPLSHKFKAPFIGLSTMDASPMLHCSMGNAMHPAAYPVSDLGFEHPLSFTDRLLSTAVTLAFQLLFYYASVFFVDEHIKKYIVEDAPYSYIVEGNASLLFVNANPVFYPTRPISPLTINLEGGIHLRDPEALPKDIQTYLDKSKDGCIYFSFGSTVNSNALSPEVIEIFRKTFEELAPMRVLWKFENETLPNKPANLELRKWLPQQDVLRHPNVKLFITQGGLQSLEEAIDSAVPMLGMPFYGDQINNVNKMVAKQFGMRLDVKTMDKESLKNTILELLNNPLYRKNVEKYSKIQKDRPMNPLEKAVWWTEYVLRHGGTSHLRSPSADIPLYQYLFLDIIAFVTVVLIFISLLFWYSFKLIRFVFRKIFSSKTKGNKIKVN